jgi:hypothetical protein
MVSDLCGSNLENHYVLNLSKVAYPIPKISLTPVLIYQFIILRKKTLFSNEPTK